MKNWIRQNANLIERVLLLAAVGLAVAAVALVRQDAATQAQLGRVQRDSCHVFRFVDRRFLVPTKTETASQKQITAQFAAELHQSVVDCARAGYN